MLRDHQLSKTRIDWFAQHKDTANWCLGRPSATQISNSHTLGGGGAVTRSSDVTWDGAACRATQARLEPGHAMV